MQESCRTDEAALKTITIRKIPPELARELRREAEKEGASLAKTVIRLLLRATGLSPDGERRNRWEDLDELAGTWTAEEAGVFDEAVSEQRRVDPDVWA
jgi:hypothetical protein